MLETFYLLTKGFFPFMIKVLYFSENNNTCLYVSVYVKWSEGGGERKREREREK